MILGDFELNALDLFYQLFSIISLTCDQLVLVSMTD